MQTFTHLLRAAQLPAPAFSPAVQFLLNRRHQPGDINHLMPGKDLRQATGQIAGKAAVWPLVQVEAEMQTAVILPFEGQSDVVCAFFRVAKQGFKKIRAPLGREAGSEHPL